MVGPSFLYASWAAKGFRIAQALRIGKRSLKLTPRQVEKPWGRLTLPAPFHNDSGEPTGEIWFEDGRNSSRPFLVKYIFTSERLSVQVHPNDVQAAAKGQPRGKTECWYVLDSEPGAEIGLGLTEEVTAEALRTAAIDGSVMDMLDWRKVAAGDFFYVPAGTVHAIGAGVSLLEFQQNSEITYRLFDYGRPRELHLDEAIEAASLVPLNPANAKSANVAGSILHSGSDFTFVRARRGGDVPAALNDRLRWVMPIAGTVSSNSDIASAGECLLVEAEVPLRFGDDAVALIAAGGAV